MDVVKEARKKERGSTAPSFVGLYAVQITQITYVAYTVASLSINANGPIINSISIEKATFDIINNRNWVVKSFKSKGSFEHGSLGQFLITFET